MPMSTRTLVLSMIWTRILPSGVLTEKSWPRATPESEAYRARQRAAWQDSGGSSPSESKARAKRSLSSVAPSTTAGHLWKTVNNGGSWVSLDGNGLPAGVPVNIVTSDPGDPNTVYAGTHFGVYRSQDGGASWTRFGAGLPMVNVTDIYISEDSSLVRVATYGRGIWELASSSTGLQ